MAILKPFFKSGTWISKGTNFPRSPNWHALQIQPKHPLIDSSCLAGIITKKMREPPCFRHLHSRIRPWYFKRRPCLCGIEGIEISLQFEFWNECILTLWSHLSKHEHFLENSLGLLAKPISTAIKDELACSQCFGCFRCDALIWGH